MSTDLDARRDIMKSVKDSLPKEAMTSRDENTMRGSIFTSLVIARHLGFTKDETLAVVKEEWLHLTEIDNRTVKGAK